jgi:type IV pilus biogenesis protein CpaD/CtpE
LIERIAKMSMRARYANSTFRATLLTLTVLSGMAFISLGSCALAPKSPAAPATIVTQHRFGSSLEAAFAAQVANPEAADMPAQSTITNGARAVLAADNYRKGTTKPLVRESTSSTKREGGGS